MILLQMSRKTRGLKRGLKHRRMAQMEERMRKKDQRKKRRRVGKKKRKKVS